MKCFSVINQQQTVILFITTVLINVYQGVSATLDSAAFRYDTFDTPKRKCEPIMVEMCKDDLGYNFTGGPNFLNEDTFTQRDSQDFLMTFKPLISHGCSRQLKSFLCTAYVPMCDPQVEQLIGPCRSVCENVKASTSKYQRKKYIRKIKTSKKGTKYMITYDSEDRRRISRKRIPSPEMRRCQPFLKTIGYAWPVDLNCSVFPATNQEDSMCMEFPKEDDDDTISDVEKSTPPTVPAAEPCSSTRKPSAYKYLNSTKMCHPRCDIDNLFNHKEKQFAEIWMAVWTSFCLLFSLMTVVTFLIDTSKFHYPKRPIIFLSLCYVMYSIGYLVRLIAGREGSTCDSNNTMTQGLDNTNCAAIFLLLYYFNTAAAIWWVIFSVTWLLSAGLKWSHDAIELYTSYFHLIAWGIPAIQSIIIIVLRNVSSEELTGLCFVSSNSPASLLGFVIAPFTAYLLLGIIFLVAGYIVLFRQEKKEVSKSEERMDVLMVRIGIFSVLYTVPATCLLACYFYEYFNFQSWYNEPHLNIPSAEIYMLRVVSSLLPGVTSGLCVLGCNTLDTWANISCLSLCSKQYSSSNKPYQQSNNNNNNSTARQYIPVNVHHSKKMAAGSNRTSSSRSSTVRSHHYNPNQSHRYLHSPLSSQSLRHPTEYHV